jgi:glucuronate isomerase
MDKGLIPAETKLAGRIVKDICYNNDRDYFGFE